MKDEEFDLEEIRYYMRLTPRQKLEYLEKMNRFLLKIRPKNEEKGQTVKGNKEFKE